MTGALDGLTILAPESRELNLFAQLLEAEGAVAVRCPLVQILDLDDVAEAEAWIERLIAGAFQDVIWLTHEGLRRLLPIAERNGRRAFVEALGRSRMITRGPKPARALRELGLRVGLAAAPSACNSIPPREDRSSRLCATAGPWRLPSPPIATHRRPRPIK